MGDLEEEEPQLEALPYQQQQASAEGHDHQRMAPELESTLSDAQFLSHDPSGREGEILSEQDEARDEADFDRMLEQDIKAAERCDPLGGRMQLMEQERHLASSVRRDVDQELWKELDDFDGAKEEEAARRAAEQEYEYQAGSTTEEESKGASRESPTRGPGARRAVPPRTKARAAKPPGGAGRGLSGAGTPEGEEAEGVENVDDEDDSEDPLGLGEADEVYQKELESSLEDHLVELRIEEQQHSDALMEAAASQGPDALPRGERLWGAREQKGAPALGSGDIAGGE